MLHLALSSRPGTAEFTHPKTKGETLTRSGTRESRTLLRSQVRGRERWYVDVLEDNPRLAAAVEVALRSEEGIDGANANPLTGRVLVHYNPDRLSESVEALIRRAIGFGPMSREEFSALPSQQRHFFGAKRLIAAEIGCSAVKMFLLGGFCPLGLAAAGILLFCYQRSLT